MPKLTYNDKANINPVANRDTQATAEDFNEIKGSVNAVYDGALDTVFPVKSGEEFTGSNLSQDPTGEIRAKTQIIAEQGIDSTPATYVSGDGMDISSSGPSQVNKSRITGVRYQIPYQEIDKTGSGKTFTPDAGAEVREPGQSVSDTQLTPPSSYSTIAARNEIINAYYVKTDGDVSNYRFRIKAQPSGNVVLSYPDKFRYARDEGVSLIGAGIHKIDLYFVDGSSPARFINGQNLDLEEKWESAGGFILGNSANEPWYESDVQEFEIVETNPFTDAEKAKLDGITCSAYLGVFVDLAALQAAYPTANNGDTATVTDPTSNLYYWDDLSWEDSGTGFMGDMLKSIYDPFNHAADSFSMANMVEGPTSKILTLSERNRVSASTEDVTLSSDDTTQESLGLTGQEITASLVTQTSDGLQSKGDKVKLDALPTLLQINDTNGYEIATSDSTQTSGEIEVSDLAQTQITNNGLGGNSANLPSTVTEFVVTPDGDALLDQVDGIYSISVQFMTRPSDRDKAFLIEFIAQNGGSPIQIFSRSLRFTKEITTEQVSVSFTIAAIASIVNLPISVYITTTGTATDVWGQSLSVTKNNAPIV